MTVIKILYCHRRLEVHPLQVRYKQDWGRGFILLLHQAAVLPGSDAGSDVVKPASSLSSKTVRPRAPCGARCMEHAIRTWSACYSKLYLSFEPLSFISDFLLLVYLLFALIKFFLFRAAFFLPNNYLFILIYCKSFFVFDTVSYRERKIEFVSDL